MTDQSEDQRDFTDCLFSRRFSGELPEGARISDNLKVVLFKICKQKASEFQKTRSDLSDIWDFWEIMAFQSCGTIEKQNKNLRGFREKHPGSPLSKLQIIDPDMEFQQFHEKRSNEAKISQRGSYGGGFLLGANYNWFHNAASSLVPNNISFVSTIDIISNDFLYQIGIDVTGVKTQKELINIDTLKRGAQITLSKFSFSIGKTLGPLFR